MTDPKELHEPDIESLVDTLDVDGCVRLACHVPLTSTVPSTSRIDPRVVDSLVAELRRYASELDDAASALWEEEEERAMMAMAQRESIDKSATEIKRSLDAMTQSLERLAMDVEGSLGTLDELGRGVERVRDAKEAVAGCMRILEKVEVARGILTGADDQRGAGDPRGRVEDQGDVERDGPGEIDGRLYHAAKLYARSMREIKARQSRQLVTLRGVGDAVQSLKPLLDEQVRRLVTAFLESASVEKLADIGRDAMSGEGISSERFDVDPLSYAVVVTRAYDPMLVGRVREQYVEHREQQLGGLLGNLSCDALNLAPLVGFFLMEMAVSEVMETGSFLQDMWDGVGAAIGAEVGAALDESDGWEEMLELKRDVVRACQAFSIFGETLNTTPLTSSVVKRSARYEGLVGAEGVSELEASEEDVEKIDEAVRACCSRVAAYVEGLVGDAGREVEVAQGKVDDILGDILEGALDDISSLDDSVDRETSIRGLLSFVETVSCILRSVEGVYGSQEGFRTLRRLMETSGRRTADMLAMKAFDDAKDIRKADGDEQGALLSAWCDALIEEFEFIREELDDYGFGRDVGRNIAGWYAGKLRELVETHMRHVTEKDLAALTAALTI